SGTLATPNSHSLTDPDPSDNAVLLIEISGASLGGATLFQFVGGGGPTVPGSIVRGLVINNMAGESFQIGPFASLSNNNTIAGNFLGTDVTGASFLSGGNTVISVESGTGNTIGGTAAKDRNVIVGGGGGT